jgi:hypothetical protein
MVQRSDDQQQSFETNKGKCRLMCREELAYRMIVDTCYSELEYGKYWPCVLIKERVVEHGSSSDTSPDLEMS